MVPGTALGVLAGDLAYTWLAVRLMRRSGREDVTAMPFGIDTPALFGIIHSPQATGALFWPWAAGSPVPPRLAGAYGVVAAVCWLAALRAPRAAPTRISA